MPEASARCPACGAELPPAARFCPDCGLRTGAREPDPAEKPTGADPAEEPTVVEPLPPEETGPVPVHMLTAEPRWFGVTPATAILVLALPAVGLSIALLVRGQTLAGAVLAGAAATLLVLFAAAATQRPDSAVARATAGAATSVRARAGLTFETLAAQGSAHVDFIRTRRELEALHRRRALEVQALGEAVYGEDESAADEARARVRAVEGEIAAKEARMQTIVANAQQRVQRARLEVQPTEVRAFDPPGPQPVPEPMPAPSPPIEPPLIPEPSPEPSPPVEPPQVPEPTPEPTEPTPTIEA